MSTMAAPDDDRPLALSRSRTNVVFVTILLGMLLAALDQTIVSTALPTIVADLGGPGHIAWVVTAYILAEAFSTVLAGKFGNLFGRRLVFQVKAVVFVGASAVAYVEGVSATTSGLRIPPMVAGLLLTATLSGDVVGRTGRDKVFPVVGMAVLALGLYLLSTMKPDTGIWLQSVYMFVLGLGLGLGMQVLTIVVQNTVAYAQLGTATSGVTFFRTIGGSFGTAVFGALYTNRLEPDLGLLWPRPASRPRRHRARPR